MATKYQPQQASYTGGFDFFKWLTTPVYTRQGAYSTPSTLMVAPSGYYSGQTSYSLSPTGNTVVTNPYGTTAKLYTTSRQRELDNYSLGGLFLQPGQSFNLATGALSDPNLHAGTAKRLNDAGVMRALNEVGINTGGETSSRNSKSLLANLDDMYWGNVNTQVAPQSEALTQLTQAKQTGFNTTRAKTILGTAAPIAAPTVAAPTRKRG